MKFKVYYKDELILSTDNHAEALREIYSRLKEDNSLKREDFTIYMLTAK